MSWRDQCKGVIADVLARTRGQDERSIRKALREAYPFGPRVHWPYKVWIDEIRRQRGRKKSRSFHNPAQQSLFKNLST